MDAKEFLLKARKMCEGFCDICLFGCNKKYGDCIPRAIEDWSDEEMEEIIHIVENWKEDAE
jgi:hypothetical protein